jgi:hypothetical protein
MLGGAPGGLFTAFVGLVSARDRKVGGECLLALEEAVLSGAGGNSHVAWGDAVYDAMWKIDV